MVVSSTSSKWYVVHCHSGFEKKIADAIMDEAGLDALVAANFNIGSNADYNLLTTQRELLHLDVKRYKMQRLPSLAAFYQITNTAYQLEFDFYNEADWLDAQNVGISLSIPIWSSGMQGAKIKQASFKLMKMENTIKHYEAALALQFSNNSSQLKTKIENKSHM